MSKSESPLRAVIANVVTPAHTEHVLPCLAALADHAFALAHQQAGCNPTVRSGICTENRQARILYFVEGTMGLYLPIKVVLYQDVPTVQIQRVVVNFQTGTVQCEGQPSLLLEKLQIERVQNEIKQYLRELLQTLRDIWKSPSSDKVHCSSWQDFLKRLELNGISSAQSQIYADSPFPEKPCPSCEVSTTPCALCHTVICLSGDCPVSRFIPFRSCSRHAYTAVCLPCIQNAQTTLPRIGQCPECNLWFCDNELMWCLGRPKENPKQTSCNIIRGLSSSVRLHPPQPIQCLYCHPFRTGSQCSNEDCWSREGSIRWPIVCQSCSPAGGISCACEGDWICDSCKAPPMADCLKQCPQCKRAYCDSECEYIGFCAGCGRTTLCDDCVEEDWSSFAGLDGTEVQSRGVKFVGACQADSCSSKLCQECLYSEERTCVDCNDAYCCNCSHLYLLDQQCSSCDSLSNLCGGCLGQRQPCMGCDETFCSSCMLSELCSSCERDFELDYRNLEPMCWHDEDDEDEWMYP